MKLKIKNIQLLFIVFIIVFSGNFAGASTYRVFFKDKGPGAFQPGSDLYEQTKALHSERSKARRGALDADNPFSLEDAPVYQPYIDSVVHSGATLIHKLRWNNYIVIECDTLTALTVSNFSFVDKVQKTSSKFESNQVSGEEDCSGFYDDMTGFGCGEFEYGTSLNQLDMLNIPLLHRMGITGKGVIIGLMDTGFYPEQLSIFNHLNVLRAYDFVYNDTVVCDDSNDRRSGTGHGTMVLSVLASYMNNSLVGAAPFCTLMLAKTEDISSETRIEEDNFAAGVEWLESNGADIISTSLGYSKFDSTDVNHDSTDFDGHSTIAAKAFNYAVKRGVVCITSAGNKGPAPGTIATPADADSAITVGGVMPDGITPAPFTSRGPIVSGRQKPEIAAQGKDVITINPNIRGDYFKAEGTSFASPLISGSVALMLSVHPGTRPWEIRNALTGSGTKRNSPDDTLGYGVPDIFEAIKSLGITITPPAIYCSKTKLNVLANIFAGTFFEPVLHFRKTGTLSFTDIPMTGIGSDRYAGSIPLTLLGSEGEMYITATSGAKTKRYPNDENEYISVSSNSIIIPCGIGSELLYDYLPDFTAGIYPNVVNDGDGVLNLYFSLILDNEIQVKIYSANGSLVLNEHYGRYPEGLSHIPVNLNGLASGMYYLKIVNTGFPTMKFMVLN